MKWNRIRIFLLSAGTMCGLTAARAQPLLQNAKMRQEAAPSLQAKLAELAGGSRQSVNAALATLATRGLIRLDTRRIVITDLVGLRSRAGVA